MAVEHGYVTLERLKETLGIADAQSDLRLEATIAAASRWVDGYAGRVFYASPAPEARSYTATEPYALGAAAGLEDLVAVTELATDPLGLGVYGEVWEPADYLLSPPWAPGAHQPYTYLEVAISSARAFPPTRRGVRVTAVWGWPAVPDVVAMACLLQALRLYKRPEAPFGLTGLAEFGTQRALGRVDPDVADLLAPYRRRMVFA